MHAHDEHGSRVFFGGPRKATAHELWRAQHELEEVGERPAIRAAENPANAHAEMLANWVAEAQEAFGGRVFRIPTQTRAELTRQIEQLDRRARKLGSGSIRLHDAGETDPDGCTFLVLRGKAPVLAGWTLAAIIDHRDEHATLRPVTERGAHLPAGAFAHPRCEQCGLRRRRAKTFVVTNTTSGETRQVGSACLRDFLGGHDPDRACRQAEYLALARGALDHADRLPPVESVRAGAPELPLEQFAAHAARIVCVHGRISRARARGTSEQATADRALRSLETTPDAPSRADRALANAALSWARTLLPTKPGLTAFEHDALEAITTGPTLARRDRGLICALVDVYRHQRARSRHLATPGTSIEVTAVVERVTPHPSARYGTVHRCELRDADANLLAWWQTRGTPLRVGEVVALRGFVERHTRFGRTAVTVLSHCRRETRRSAKLAAGIEASSPRPAT